MDGDQHRGQMKIVEEHRYLQVNALSRVETYFKSARTQQLHPVAACGCRRAAIV